MSNAFSKYEIHNYCRGEGTEQEKEFCYLVSIITSDARCHREIRSRITIIKETFSKRTELLREKLDIGI